MAGFLRVRVELRRAAALLPAVRRVCLLLLLAAPLGACVAVQTDLATARPGSVVVERHQRYAEGARGELDVYRQAGDVSGRPILMFFHPGAFYIGNKGHLPNRVIATELAKRGAVVVVPNYSLFPDARWPAFLEDGAAATAWAVRHAERLGADPKSLFITGHSAGAYIASMLTLDPQWLAKAGVSPEDVAGGVAASGVYFGLNAPVFWPIFGVNPEEAPLQSPGNFAGPSRPPMLMMAGLLDPLGGQVQNALLADSIRSANGQVESIVYPHLAHMELLSTLGGFPPLAPVASDIMAFVNKRVTYLAQMRARGPVQDARGPAQAPAAGAPMLTVAAQ